jgi:hypothetical protein
MVEFTGCTGTAAATHGGMYLVTMTAGETGEVHRFVMTATAVTALHAALESAGIGE